MEFTELYIYLVLMILNILPNVRQADGNSDESLERYKIDGKVTIQGFKPAGKTLNCVFSYYSGLDNSSSAL